MFATKKTSTVHPNLLIQLLHTKYQFQFRPYHIPKNHQIQYIPHRQAVHGHYHHENGTSNSNHISAGKLTVFPNLPTCTNASNTTRLQGSPCSWKQHPHHLGAAIYPIHKTPCNHPRCNACQYFPAKNLPHLPPILMRFHKHYLPHYVHTVALI